MAKDSKTASAAPGARREPSDRPAGDASQAIKVTARPASFRRAGFTFTGEGTVIRADRITETQMQALMDEPNLVVQQCEPLPEPEETVETKAVETK